MSLRIPLLLIVLSATAAAQDTTRVVRDSSASVAEEDRYAPPDSARLQSLRPLFRWPSAEGQPLYRLQIARDSLFLSVVFQDSAVGDTVRRCDTLLQNDSLYYWRVGPADSSGIADFSGVRSFLTGPPPDFSLSSYFFPSTRRGDTAAVQVYIKNPVADTVRVDSVVTSTGLFWLPDSVPPLLPPSDSLLIRVCFRPRFFNLYEDSVTVYTSQGRGVLLVGGDSPPPLLGVDGRDLQMGPVAESDTATGTVVIRNVAFLNDLTVLKVATRTPFFTPLLPAVPVRPEDSLSVTVRFNVRAVRPEGYGVYYDTLTVITDGGIGKVALRGDSPPPRIIASARALDFGLVGALDTSFSSLQVRNGSINPLRIDSVKTKGKAFRPTVTKGRVSRSDTLLLSVRFQPDRCGPFADTLTCYNNSWTGPLRIPLTGFAPYPVLETDYDRVSFGTVEKNDSGTVTVRITNSSMSFLKIDSVLVKTRRFSVTRPPLPQIVRMGDALKLSLCFRPDSVFKYSDTLIIVNSSRTPRVAIPLLGEGVPSTRDGARMAGGAFQAFQNYPNPFRSATTFAYNLPTRCRVHLEVWTTLGQRAAVVVDAEQDAGMRTMPWETDLPSGVYYFRLTAIPIDGSERQYVETRKMVIVR